MNHSHHANEEKRYICPMHPEVKGAKGGSCPKCGMKLVPAQTSLKRVAFSATLHCLTGCAIGEVLGMVIGTALGWSDVQTIVLAIILAFFFGYSLTILPLLRAKINFKKALPLAFASDTVSISVMEIIDNAVIILIPGALHAHIDSPLFWGSLIFALLAAFLVTFPINMYLISKGKGHAIAHSHH